MRRPPLMSEGVCKRRRTSTFRTEPQKTSGTTINCIVNASITVVGSGVYVFGGFHQYTGEVYNEVYTMRLDDLVWKQVYVKGEPPSKRSDHTASLWRGDRLVIFGGTDEVDAYCNDVVILNFATHSWERPTVSGFIPNGKNKHSAVIHNDRLYIVGGCSFSGTSSLMHCLDLNTMEWQEPVPFEAVYSHFSWVYEDRLYVYGGYNNDMDRLMEISVLDLKTYETYKILIKGETAPVLAGQHFAQFSNNKLIVILTQCLKHGSSEIQTGVYSLDMQTLQWTNSCAGNWLEVGNWYYFAMEEERSHFHLFGTIDIDSDEYLGSVLTLDLPQYGLFSIPNASIASDFGSLFEEKTLTDFEVISADENSPTIPVHRVVLLARWPHFANIHKSGMNETLSQSMKINEPYQTVKEFIRYLYTDKLDTLPVETVARLMVLGNMYFLPRLQKLCARVLYHSIDIDNVARVYRHAVLAQDPGLKRKALEFIFKNYGLVVRSEGFRTMPQEALLDLWDHVPSSAEILIPQSLEEFLEKPLDE
ncbi:galactose oxidase [Basidiobolus meristosporus CBS 931.73]|uniref:Galactose oxidase n=1 Tax=Basidiobolus meristosporus CBS 931.73 TaxID=1314790 RepID=A0A1Y1Y9A8_9FUNG|nr:galactose oxidase [Basidiobolus meristosporus CBS 931.73]|eukprot:ORX94573.1 galactose oxidase [Basidiobolus meristosporus CBS 931.73]